MDEEAWLKKRKLINVISLLSWANSPLWVGRTNYLHHKYGGRIQSSIEKIHQSKSGFTQRYSLTEIDLFGVSKYHRQMEVLSEKNYLIKIIDC